jgi:hypothetical protein
MGEVQSRKRLPAAAAGPERHPLYGLLALVPVRLLARRGVSSILCQLLDIGRRRLPPLTNRLVGETAKVRD